MFFEVSALTITVLSQSSASLPSTRTDEHRGMSCNISGWPTASSFVSVLRDLVRQAWWGVATALRQAAPTIGRDIGAPEFSRRADVKTTALARRSDGSKPSPRGPSEAAEEAL